MTDISFLGLSFGVLLMLIPFAIFTKLRVPLVQSTFNGLVRMIVQLYLVGLYMQYLFVLDRWYVNLIWAIIMSLVAVAVALQRTRLRLEVMLLPLAVSFIASGLAIGLYFMAVVVGLNNVFTAQYFIPIIGLLLGNMLSVNVIALGSFYDGLRRERQTYYYLLGNGATKWEASLPLLRSAIAKAFNPCIANMAVMGLVSMPGTMIGQILGGSSPATAIRYQIIIVVITFVASITSLLATLLLAHRRTFDSYGRIQDVYVA